MREGKRAPTVPCVVKLMPGADVVARAVHRPDRPDPGAPTLSSRDGLPTRPSRRRPCPLYVCRLACSVGALVDVATDDRLVNVGGMLQTLAVGQVRVG